jgi:hypothetical protein
MTGRQPHNLTTSGHEERIGSNYETAGRYGADAECISLADRSGGAQTIEQWNLSSGTAVIDDRVRYESSCRLCVIW